MAVGVAWSSAPGLAPRYRHLCAPGSVARRPASWGANDYQPDYLRTHGSADHDGDAACDVGFPHNGRPDYPADNDGDHNSRADDHDRVGDASESGNQRRTGR